MLQEFSQELKNYMQDTLRDCVHTAIPGEIVSFDPVKCEAAVKPYAKYTKPNGEKIDFPEISSAPVYFMQGLGQKASVVYPVEGGDECLIFFAEQALDTWRTRAESETDLRFDLTNAMVLVGLFSKPNPLVQRACDNKSIILQREETFVEIYEDKVHLKSTDRVHVESASIVDVEAPSANLTCDDITLTGKVAINGDLTVDGNISNTGNMTTGGAHTDSIGGHS